jgi:hypothetical protein
MRFQMVASTEMAKALKDEAKKRKLDTIQETIRSILSEYFMLRKTSEEKPERPKPRRIESTNPLAH